ncbi:MAG: cell division protein ZapA [Candidatus Gastranaerophilales bacterium]|nr:cell division protein ZapA [Candidatus Gastranaerophilales bacterium]
MSSKIDTEVIIGGKVFTLSGYESEEYLQKVASYINNKANEYNKVESFKRQPLDTQSVLMQLNIADDFFKARTQVARLEEELQAKEKEMYDLKHELISAQIKLETAEKQSKESASEIDSLKQEVDQLQKEADALKQTADDNAKKIANLEAELKGKQK